MGTEILQPQGCLAGRIRNSPALFGRRRGCNYGNSYTNSRINPNPSPNPRTSRKQQHPPVRSEKSNQKRRSGQPEQFYSKRSSSDDDRVERVGLVKEKVTILRRGASLDSKIKSKLSLKKDGDQPAAKQVQPPELRSPIKAECDVYAGLPFAVSPEPSSLPLPSFSKKKMGSFDDSATRDLRRLLRLD